MGILYSKESKQQLLRYADARYLSYPHKAGSQTGYVFNCNGTAISWRSMIQNNEIIKYKVRLVEQGFS